MNGLCVNKKIKRKYAHIFDHFQTIFLINLFYIFKTKAQLTWNLKSLIALVGKINDVSTIGF